MLTEITYGQYVGRAKIFGNFRKSSFISRFIRRRGQEHHDGVHPTKISGAGEAGGRSKDTTGRRTDLTADEPRELAKWDGYWNGNADKHYCNVHYEDLKNVRYDDIFHMTRWSEKAPPEIMRSREDREHTSEN